MKVLINRIEIHQDKQVDIILNTAHNKNNGIKIKNITEYN